MNKLLISLAIAIFINIVLTYIGQINNVDLISIAVGLFCYLILELFVNTQDNNDVDDGLQIVNNKVEPIIEEPEEQLDFQLANYIEKHLYKTEDEKYLPCFRLCKNSQLIFDILEENNLLDKYINLLELHSSVLCLEHELVNENVLCEKALNKRINNLVKNNIISYKNASNVASSKLNIIMDGNVSLQTKPSIIKYLNAVIQNIEQDMNSLDKDTKITTMEKKKIRKYNEGFYKTHFRPIVDKCLYDTY